MQKLRIGLAGLSRGRGFVNVFSAHPEVEIVALCDPNSELLSKTAEAFKLNDNQLFEKYDDFINADFDIAVIATPIPLHTEHTVKAVQAGKHVLCEQTVAYTVEECREVFREVKKSGKIYMMAENYTYFHYIKEWQTMIDQGKLGEIVYAEAEYIHEITGLLENKETGSFYWRADRPPIWYCAHCLGPILTLMKDRAVKVSGMHSGFHRFPDRKDKPGFLDMEVAIFQTEKGKVIKILRSQTPVRPHMVWYTLYGTKGSVENGRFNKNGVLYLQDEMGEENKAHTPFYDTIDIDAPKEANTGGHGTSEYYLIRDFINAVKNNTQPPIDVARSLDFTVPGIIAHQSALKGGKLMDVPLIN
jgi:predicted dehydrogenase